MRGRALASAHPFLDGGELRRGEARGQVLVHDHGT